jgi:hypothetical protein
MLLERNGFKGGGSGKLEIRVEMKIPYKKQGT